MEMKWHPIVNGDMSRVPRDEELLFTVFDEDDGETYVTSCWTEEGYDGNLVARTGATYFGAEYLTAWMELPLPYKPKNKCFRKKAMISQPMNGLTDEEIEKTRDKAIEHLERLGYKVVNTLFTDDLYSKSAMRAMGVENIPLFFLAKSLEKMSLCDVAYFCDGWEDDRGCRVEHDAAEEYELDIIYAEDEDEPEATLTDEQKTFME